MCSIDLEVFTGYYHRFCRKGIIDFLPTPTSPYEKSLAVCADHIVLEWEQNCCLEFFRLPEPWENLTIILNEVKATLSKLIQRRCNLTMTKAEASLHNFKGKIITTISDFLHRMPSPYMLVQAYSETSSYYMFMLKVEYNLNPILAPWVDSPSFNLAPTSEVLQVSSSGTAFRENAGST